MKLSVIVILAFFIQSCTLNRIPEGTIKGELLWFEGNLMPGIDRDPVFGIPVERNVLFYEITNFTQAAAADGVFYRDLSTRLIKKVRSGQNGRFKVKLPEGKYSMFIEEESGLFASQADGAGNINPVEVIGGKIIQLEIRIDYKAAY